MLGKMSRLINLSSSSFPFPPPPPQAKASLASTAFGYSSSRRGKEGRNLFGRLLVVLGGLSIGRKGKGREGSKKLQSGE